MKRTISWVLMMALCAGLVAVGPQKANAAGEIYINYSNGTEVGVWKSVNGADCSSKASIVADASASNGYALKVSNVMNKDVPVCLAWGRMADGTVEMRVKVVPVHAADNAILGIGFRTPATTSRIFNGISFMGLQGATPNTLLAETQNTWLDTYTDAARQAVVRDTYYTVKIEYVGKTVSVWVDGVQKISSHTWQEWNTSAGYMGFYGWARSQDYYVDWVRITEANLTTKDKAAITVNELSPGYNSGDTAGNVTHNLTLPTANPYGLQVEWSSSDPGVISRSGTVSRATVDKKVNLRVIVYYGGSSNAKEGYYRDFSVTVKGTGVTPPPTPPAPHQYTPVKPMAESEALELLRALTGGTDTQVRKYFATYLQLLTGKLSGQPEYERSAKVAFTLFSHICINARIERADKRINLASSVLMTWFGLDNQPTSVKDKLVGNAVEILGTTVKTTLKVIYNKDVLIMPEGDDLVGSATNWGVLMVNALGGFFAVRERDNFLYLGTYLRNYDDENLSMWLEVVRLNSTFGIDTTKMNKYAAWIHAIEQSVITNTTVTYTARCPVIMEVYDRDDNLIITLDNEQAGAWFSEQGSFYVEPEQGSDNFVKTAMIDDSKYHVVIKGCGTGSMDYSVSRKQEDGSVVAFAAADIAVTDTTVATPIEGDVPLLGLVDTASEEPGEVLALGEVSIPQCKITVGHSAGGYALCDSVVNQGTSVTLTAYADDGFAFDGWYENDVKIVGAGESYTFTALSDRAVMAKFVAAPPPVDPNLTSYGRLDVANGVATAQIDAAKLSALLVQSGAPVKVVVSDAAVTTLKLNLTVADLKTLAARSANLWVETPFGQLDLSAAAVDTRGRANADAVELTVAKAAVSAKSQTLGQPVGFALNVAGKDASQLLKFVPFYLPLAASDAPTAAVLVGAKGGLEARPFKTVSLGGKRYGVIMSRSTGVLAFRKLATSFTDTATHWGNAVIVGMANRMVVNGTGNNEYQPERAITRAEFVALIVRALGLKARGSAQFGDVKAAAWYYDVVLAAKEYGIAKGSGGKFLPDNKITREEAMLLMVNALKLVRQDVALTAAQKSAALKRFGDAGEFSSWATDGGAAAIHFGIVGGSNGNIHPKKNLTRAETAQILYNMLKKEGYIV